MRIFLPVFFLLFASSCFLDKPIGTKVNETYGPFSRNKMDVYFPNYHDSATAVVILIHGGGWVAGNKNNWSREIINNITQQGFAVSAINYRYADGDFNHQMQDVQMALEHIGNKANDWKICGNKFALIGGSAGAHLSLLYAHAFDTAHLVKAVVSMAGPTDMGDSVFQQYAKNYLIGFVFEQFLGATEQNNPQVYRDASPVFYHSQVPTLLIHGSLDNLVPPTHSQMMFDSLHFYGITADTTFFGNAGHDVTAGGANNTQIYTEMKNWLAGWLH